MSSRVVCDISISVDGYAAGHIDELRTHVAPVVMGAGERLFAGVPPLNLEIAGGRTASLVTHVIDRVRR